MRQQRDNVLVAAALAFSVLGVLAYVPWQIEQDRFAIDFLTTTWEPGQAVLEGESAYPEPGSTRQPALYPPPYIVLFSPISTIPSDLASTLWVVWLTFSVVLSLWIAGLRDARCYAIALVSFPFVSGLWVGNSSALLMLTTALLWRWRDHPHRGAGALAAGILIKPIMWPLYVWIVLTRRYRLALESVISAPLIALAAWLLIGMDGFATYPDLLRSNAELHASNGILLTNLLLDAGAALWSAQLGSAAVALALLVMSRWVKDDLGRFALGTTAALLLTPVMFAHYFLLLLVPLAARYPRFSPAWLAPVVLWVIAVRFEHDGTRPLWTSVVGLVVLSVMLAALVRRDAPSQSDRRADQVVGSSAV